jgi:hypothetical protein
LERRKRRAESEAAYFPYFQKAGRSGNERGIMQTLFAWIDRANKRPDAATLDRFVREAEDPKLPLQVKRFMDRLYGQGARHNLTGEWSEKHSFTSVAGARKRLLRNTKMRIKLKELPPLNPTDSGPWDLHAQQQRSQDDLTIRGR